MQADLNLVKITAPHFQVPNTQNANQNMANMIPIAYLNKNFVDCNQNLAWDKQEPLIYSYMFWYKRTVEKLVENFILHSFYAVIIKLLSQSNINFN